MVEGFEFYAWGLSRFGGLFLLDNELQGLL